MDRCILSQWEVVLELEAPDKVNIPCLMHDTRLCQLDTSTESNIKKHKNLSESVGFGVYQGVHGYPTYMPHYHGYHIF